MQEALSYIAGAQLPVVVVNIVRAGPGLGGILPSQSDYMQAVKGGGHGDYKLIVLAPASVQEAVDLTMKAFYLADKYRNPVMVMGDGMIGQMMEPVEFIPPDETDLPPKDWATTGAKGRGRNQIHSLHLDPVMLEKNNQVIAAKYQEVKKNEILFEKHNCNRHNKLLLVAYGTMARICKTAIAELKKQRISVGLFRPITLFPFAEAELYKAAGPVSHLLSVEMSMGQMVEDVERIIGREKPVSFFGRCGGIVPSPEEVVNEVKRLLAARAPAKKAKKKTAKKKTAKSRKG
jgi:2-oxoglutarate ferredoxin oxidoreductase subunit alpha